MPSRYKLLLPETDDVRSRQLTIFVTEEKWQQISRKAKRLGTSKSEVCRYILNAGLAALKKRPAIAAAARQSGDVKQAPGASLSGAVGEAETPKGGSHA